MAKDALKNFNEFKERIGPSASVSHREEFNKLRELSQDASAYLQVFHYSWIDPIGKRIASIEEEIKKTPEANPATQKESEKLMDELAIIDRTLINYPVPTDEAKAAKIKLMERKDVLERTMPKIRERDILAEIEELNVKLREADEKYKTLQEWQQDHFIYTVINKLRRKIEDLKEELRNLRKK